MGEVLIWSLLAHYRDAVRDMEGVQNGVLKSLQAVCRRISDTPFDKWTRRLDD